MIDLDRAGKVSDAAGRASDRAETKLKGPQRQLISLNENGRISEEMGGTPRGLGGPKRGLGGSLRFGWSSSQTGGRRIRSFIDHRLLWSCFPMGK